ncbi:TPA: tail fiber assembly protein [Citrobacter braakii]
MNNYFYSASQNVFIANGSQLLETSEFSDAVSVSDDVFNEFFKSVFDGMRRVGGIDGMPAWENIPPPTEEEIKAIAIVSAEQKKARLIAEAMNTISLWQTELQLGIISDDDKTSLIAWMKYIQALNSIDTSTAPDIEWLVKPE